MPAGTGGLGPSNLQAATIATSHAPHIHDKVKITRTQSQIVRVPADEQLAGGPVPPGAMRDFVTLRVATDAGIEGIGYTFFGAALTGALKSAVDALGELAIGEDPLRTEALTSAEVLKFRDEAFTRYFADPGYLDLVRRRFGEDVLAHVRGMTQVRLRRKLLEEAVAA